jgi:hypothetical protein
LNHAAVIVLLFSVDPQSLQDLHDGHAAA